MAKEQATSSPAFAGQSKAPLSLTERNLKFEAYVKTHAPDFRDNPQLANGDIAKAVAYLDIFEEERKQSPWSWSQTLSVYDIYNGLLALGTKDAQVVAIGGLLDTDGFVRKEAMRKFESSQIHEAVFQHLATNQNGQKIIIELIDGHTQGTGFDEHGRVFPSVEAAIQNSFAQDLDDEGKTKLALTAAKVHGQAVNSVSESERTGQEGLSEETKNIVAGIFCKNIASIIEKVRDVKNDENLRTRLSLSIASTNFDAARKIAGKTLTEATAKEKEAEAAKQKEKGKNETKHTRTINSGDEIDKQETEAERLAKEIKKRKIIAEALKKLQPSMEIPTAIDATKSIEALRKLYVEEEQMPEKVKKTINEYEGFISFLNVLACRMLPDMILERETISRKFQEKEEAKHKQEKAELDARIEEAKAREAQALALRETTHANRLTYAREMLGLEIEPEES